MMIDFSSVKFEEEPHALISLFYFGFQTILFTENEEILHLISENDESYLSIVATYNTEIQQSKINDDRPLTTAVGVRVFRHNVTALCTIHFRHTVIVPQY